MADNSNQGGSDVIRDLDRLGAGVKTPVSQIDMGGAAGNAEVLLSAGQKPMATSLPVVIASDQTALPSGGDVAAGAADSGKPLKTGGKANSSAPTPVTAGQRADDWSDLFGRKVVSDLDPELNLSSSMTNYRERVVAPRYTVLADSIADGLASFWTSTVANGGTTSVVSGEGLIQSNTATNGSAQLVSTIPPYLPGQTAWSISASRFGDTGVAGNTRRVGVATVSGTTPQDGFYFELLDTTFNAVSVKAGVATAVPVASWSRAAVAPFTLDTNYHFFEIRWTGNRVDFFIDNVLRHTVAGTNTTLTGTLSFPMLIQSISTSGTTNRIIAVRNIGIGRFGTPESATLKAASTGAAATDVAIVVTERPTRGNVTFNGRVITPRTPGRAGTAGQKIWSIFNTDASIMVDVHTIMIDQYATAAKVVAPPTLKLVRITAAPTNGTSMNANKTPFDTVVAASSSANVTILADASADGTSSATTLTQAVAIGVLANVLSTVFCPRLLTVAGNEGWDRWEFLSSETEYVTLRTNQGLLLFLDYNVATSNPITDMFSVVCDWVEYTIKV